MRLHHLVPAALVLAASAQAADYVPTATFPLPATEAKAPSLSFGGFADTAVWYAQPHKTGQVPSTYKSEERATLAFWADAELRVGWRPNEKVKGQIDLELHNQRAQHRHSTAAGADGIVGTADDTYTEPNSGSEGIITDLEQAYFTWEFQPNLYWTMGKFTSCIGMIAVDAPDLYRISQGPIYGSGPFSWYGNYGLYGGDWTGTCVVYDKDQLAVGLYAFNGFLNEPYNGDHPATNRENSDLGYAFDATFKLDDKGSLVNLEAVYDSAGAGNGPSAGDGLSGDLYQVGFNGLIVADALKAGGEVIYRHTTFARGGNGDRVAGTGNSLGLAAFANYTINDQMSITGMYQHVNLNYKADDTDTGSRPAANELSLALLTYPAGTPKFGVNFELTYAWLEGDQTKTGKKQRPDDGDWAFGIEGLVVIP